MTNDAVQDIDPSIMGLPQPSTFIRTSLLAAIAGVVLSMSAPAPARIIDGVTVAEGAFPEVFALSYFLDEEQTKSVLCTAVLIHPRVLLTAAHCIPKDDEIPVTLTNNSDAHAPKRTLRAEKLYRHSSFDRSNDEMAKTAYDFGLITLAAPITGVTPAKLASLNDADARMSAFKSSLTVVGYGGSRRTTVDETTGFKRSARTRAREATEFVLSAAGPRSALSAGDSGGPAFIRDTDGKLRVIGIASGTPDGVNFQRTGLPDVSLYAGIRQDVVCWMEATAKVTLKNVPWNLQCNPVIGLPDPDES